MQQRDKTIKEKFDAMMIALSKCTLDTVINLQQLNECYIQDDKELKILLDKAQKDNLLFSEIKMNYFLGGRVWKGFTFEGQEYIESLNAHYQMKVQKIGLPQKQNSSHTVYNIGDNAKIYNHSMDMSINIHHNTEITKKLNELRDEIEKISNLSQKQEALEIFQEIQEQSLSDIPKRTILNALINSLPSIDNIASIANSLISMFGK